MKPESLRIVVVVPALLTDPQDEHAISQAERSRSLCIGLLESGFNLVASLPADVFLTERLAQLQPDKIIMNAESEARDALEHVVMVTHDVDEAVLLSDKIGMLSNGPAATIGEVLSVDLPHPRALNWPKAPRTSSTAKP